MKSNSEISSANELAGRIAASLEGLGVRVDDAGRVGLGQLRREAGKSVANYAHLAHEETWTEATAAGPATVTAKVWTRAIQAALDENKTVCIPDAHRPYYIDGPLVIRSGQRLVADAAARLRLKPGTNTCMIRNANQIEGQQGPVTLGNPDTDIIIAGGIWTTLAVGRREWNGNVFGGPDQANSLHGHGVVLLNNVRGVVVRDLVISECRPHGVQISNVAEFVVDNIRFERHGRDGVHINGPAQSGIIRGIRGVTYDDMIALNAWDWKNTCMTFGPIRDMVVEDVHAGGPDSDYRAHIRLLGGTKHFPDGGRINCDIENIVVRNVSGVETFKMYDQPNLELGGHVDYADPIGDFRNLWFGDITLESPSEAAFQIASNVDGLHIEDVRLIGPRGAAPKLVQIGPMSATYKAGSSDTSKWVEVFSPDKDCTVRGFSLTGVSVDGVSRPNTREFIAVLAQTPNPDYPNTTPRGGRGKGILITAD
jgi:hypothetical protein